MRTSRLLLILSGLVLLGVMIFCSVRYKRSAFYPPVSIQLVRVTNTEVRFHLSTSTGWSVVSQFQLQETNYSIIEDATTNTFIRYDSRTQSFIHIMRFSQPLSSDKAYRVVVPYFYRGAFEQKICSWVEQHIRVLARFVPAPRKGRATSECFVVKPEASQTNPE